MFLATFWIRAVAVAVETRAVLQQEKRINHDFNRTAKKIYKQKTQKNKFTFAVREMKGRTKKKRGKFTL